MYYINCILKSCSLGIIDSNIIFMEDSNKDTEDNSGEKTHTSNESNNSEDEEEEEDDTETFINETNARIRELQKLRQTPSVKQEIQALRDTKWSILLDKLADKLSLEEESKRKRDESEPSENSKKVDQKSEDKDNNNKDIDDNIDFPSFFDDTE